MKTVAIIQARMTSSRFPGKHLAPLAGKPLIQHVLNRCYCDGVDIVVATTADPTDKPLRLFLESLKTPGFCGSLLNPLERMYRAAETFHADIVVRVTGDCPLVDTRIIEKFVDEMESSPEFDYIGSTNSPDGNDVEVFTIAALREAYYNAAPDEVEHTTTWIRKNLKCESRESDPEYADVHYSVNTVEDLKTCELLIQRVGEGARWQDYVTAYRELRG